MDDDALRAMLPMAFGGGGGRDVPKTSQPAPQPSPAEDETKEASGNPSAGGRLAREGQGDEVDFCGPMPPPDDEYDDEHGQGGLLSERGDERTRDGAPASLLRLSIP